MKEKLRYLKYVVFHPFDGFYEAKHRGKGSPRLAAAIILLYCLLRCVSYQYTGFIMNLNPLYLMNSLTIFISALSVLVLFILSNWSVTTLFDGKGSLKEITMVLGYSMVPLVLNEILVVIISNFVIQEEVTLVNAVRGIFWFWFAFLMLAGLCVIHEYTLTRNLVTLLATAAAAAILVFLFVLFISLVEQMVGFFTTIIQEGFRRW